MARKANYSRRFITVCREGWYYLFVLGFIAGGAVLRQVNPLFALAAVMIAPMLFNWRIAMSSINHLSVRRKLPTRVSAGEHLIIDVEAVNHRHRLDTYTLHIHDQIRLVQPELRDYQARAECMIARVPVGDSARTSYRCYLNRRGRYRFGPLRFSTRFPVGLVRASRLSRHADELVVAPRIGTLTPAWSNLVFKKQTGNQQAISRQGTQEGNYYAMRQWRSGDSKRWIHWRTTARLGQLMVKQYEQQSERDVTIILDAWQSESPTDVELDNVETAASLVATALMNAYQEAAGHITLGIAAKEMVYLSSQTNPGFLNEVLTQLAVAQAVPMTNLEQTLFEAIDHSSANSRVVVVTTRPIEVDELLVGKLKDAGVDTVNLKGKLVLVDVSDQERLADLFSIG